MISSLMFSLDYTTFKWWQIIIAAFSLAGCDALIVIFAIVI
jgi:hypothetical protein